VTTSGQAPAGGEPANSPSSASSPDASRSAGLSSHAEAGLAAGHGNPRIVELGRRYWLTHIPWGSPGATRECHTQLMAHAHFSSEQAWGYCANRHHEATGTWPGQKNGGKGKRAALTPSQERGAVAIPYTEPDAAPEMPGTLDLDDSWAGDLGDVPDLTGLTVDMLEAAAAALMNGPGGNG
jgi:hypothetical protein